MARSVRGLDRERAPQRVGRRFRDLEEPVRLEKLDAERRGAAGRRSHREPGDGLACAGPNEREDAVMLVQEKARAAGQRRGTSSGSLAVDGQCEAHRSPAGQPHDEEGEERQDEQAGRDERGDQRPMVADPAAYQDGQGDFRGDQG